MRVAQTFLEFRTLRLGVVIFILSLAILHACSTVDRPAIQPERSKSHSLPEDAEAKALNEGYQEFQRGDYQKAMAVFEYFYDNAEKDEIRRRATYALACTKLATAQTPKELRDAMYVWNCWLQHSAVSWQNNEDPKMITPFLERITPPQGSGDQNSLSSKSTAKPKKKTIGKLELVSRDLETYKNLLDSKEKENHRIKARLEAKEREVRRLRQQIESLEAIHLKFQEKQKEVSTP